MIGGLVLSEYTENAFDGFTFGLLEALKMWIPVLWVVLERALKGCRFIETPVISGTGREHPLKTGSFSISRTSIFLVRLAKLRELRVSR